MPHCARQRVVVLTPRLTQIEPAIREGSSVAAAVREKDTLLTVSHIAQVPALLPRHPDEMHAPVGEVAPIHHEHCIGRTWVTGHERVH